MSTLARVVNEIQIVNNDCEKQMFRIWRILQEMLSFE